MFIELESDNLQDVVNQNQKVAVQFSGVEIVVL